MTPGQPKYDMVDAEQRVVNILRRMKRVGRSEPLTSTVLGLRARISHSHARSICNRLVKQGRAKRVSVSGQLARTGWIWK